MVSHISSFPGERFVRWGLILLASTVPIVVIEIADAEEELWKDCSSPTTHYVLHVPGSLVRSTGPGITNCTYQTSDGEFTVEAVEQTQTPGPAQSIDERMQKEVNALSGTVTDQKKGENWFALTGVTGDGTEYYRVHYTNGAQLITLRITFPHSQKKKYEKWLERIDESFVAFGQKPEIED